VVIAIEGSVSHVDSKQSHEMDIKHLQFSTLGGGCCCLAVHPHSAMIPPGSIINLAALAYRCGSLWVLIGPMSLSEGVNKSEWMGRSFKLTGLPGPVDWPGYYTQEIPHTLGHRTTLLQFPLCSTEVVLVVFYRLWSSILQAACCECG
jgi:hypothetical protein